MASLRIVDFHSHFVGPELELTTLAGLPASQLPMWERVNALLADPDAPRASVEASGVAARVISAPLEFLQDPDGNVPAHVVAAMNDSIAATVRRGPGQLYGLATVDAYSGIAAATELTRAVNELGLRGVFMESAKGDLLPDAEAARPTLTAAAALGVPVFLHPVADRQLHQRFKRYGRAGARLVRGTINAVALIALVESGVFEELPDLRVVVTALAFGGALLAGGFGARNIFIDTTGLDPVMVRSAVELFGARRVLMGTDWPVIVEHADRMEALLEACGLSPAERRMIAGENTLELLGVA